VLSPEEVGLAPAPSHPLARATAPPAAPRASRLAPPKLGEHTDALLREAGYSADDVRALRAGGAVS
jgi:crotonobetainyl-CoA:carnitine CoA-transferase CaiB-like acyl-CoA transferase